MKWLLLVPLLALLELQNLAAYFRSAIQVDPWLRPFFESSLTFSTVIAVLLNQLLRIGSVAPQQVSTK